MQQWLDFWRRAAAWGWTAPAALPLPSDPGRLRNLWLTDLTRATDRYLRSNAFLELMQLNLTVMTQAARLMVWPPFR